MRRGWKTAAPRNSIRVHEFTRRTRHALMPARHTLSGVSGVSLATPLCPACACAGASRAADENAVGTWAYLAPEYKTEGRSSPSTDAWALGLCLLQLVLGRDPKDIIRTVQQALEECKLPQVGSGQGQGSSGQGAMKRRSRAVAAGRQGPFRLPQRVTFPLLFPLPHSVLLPAADGCGLPWRCRSWM